jgi:hypothetical protein
MDGTLWINAAADAGDRMTLMTAKDRRYLPVIDAAGNWIDFPFLFLLARMAYADNEDEAAVWQLYDFMRRYPTEQITVLEKDIESRHVRHNLRLRLFAGSVVREIIRIAAAGRAPNTKAAIRLAAHHHYARFNVSSPKHLEREVKRGFSDYRNTAHLQAAWLLLCQDFETETSKSDGGTMRLLGRARAIEIFIDNNLAKPGFKWHPWRVPELVEPEFRLGVERLTQNDLLLVGSADQG